MGEATPRPTTRLRCGAPVDPSAYRGSISASPRAEDDAGRQEPTRISICNLSSKVFSGVNFRNSSKDTIKNIKTQRFVLNGQVTSCSNFICIVKFESIRDQSRPFFRGPRSLRTLHPCHRPDHASRFDRERRGICRGERISGLVQRRTQDGKKHTFCSDEYGRTTLQPPWPIPTRWSSGSLWAALRVFFCCEG